MVSLLRPLAALRRTLGAHRRALLPYSTSPAEPTPKGAYVLPLPKLSHLMASGAVAKWRVREGDAFPAYAILAEVDAVGLVEPCYAQGAFAGRVRMLIEAQQAGVVARIMVPATDADEDGGGEATGARAGGDGGGDLPVGTPIAVVVGEDELEDAEAEAEARGEDPGIARERAVAAARAWLVPSTDVLNRGQPAVPVLEWQSFLASDKGGGGGGMCAPGAEGAGGGG